LGGSGNVIDLQNVRDDAIETIERTVGGFFYQNCQA
jgi:hypothetical protein